LKLTREIKTAILVVASILLFIWGIASKGKTYLVAIRHCMLNTKRWKVNFLSRVTLNGLEIGVVSN
jgi:phospholipid/cholesterol/gamma-HCH transport system substrate-binding protein